MDPRDNLSTPHKPDTEPRPAWASDPPMPSQPLPATPAEAFQIARDSDAPINERLATYSTMVRAMGSPTYAIVDRLVELLARGPVAIAFHRGHWCPYCRINAHGLAQINDQATAAGGQIVAITPERQEFTTRHKRDADAAFRMLTDFANGYAISLNLAIWVGEELKQY